VAGPAEHERRLRQARFDAAGIGGGGAVSA
jgi:hypothetical protein